VTSRHDALRTTLLGVAAITAAVALAPTAGAQPVADSTGPVPGPVQVATADADGADPAAVAACGQFAQVLDATATYYGDFADSLDSTQAYGDPSVADSNTMGRTALRQGAGVALSAANTPGLPPAVANPMRAWSFDATKLLIKMGLRGGPNSLDTTAVEMNDNALAVQQACADAGTHA
jgi:hypothetical protein